MSHVGLHVEQQPDEGMLCPQCRRDAAGHTEQGASAERLRIVAWLREIHAGAHLTASQAASAIERGKHGLP